MIRDEQETTVSYGANDEIVRIFSTVPKHIRKLRAREGVVITRDEGDLVFAEVDRGQFDPFTGFKRKSRPMTPAEKEAAVARLARAREAKK